MCIKCLIMHIRCIFSARCRRAAVEKMPRRMESSKGVPSMSLPSPVQEGKTPARRPQKMASIQTYLNSLFIIPPFLRGVPSLN